MNAEIDRMIERSEEVSPYTDPIDLNATIAVVHGDEVIATTADGLTFEEVSDRFRHWITAGATLTPTPG